MAFKMNPPSMTQGTSSHKSALLTAKQSNTPYYKTTERVDGQDDHDGDFEPTSKKSMNSKKSSTSKKSMKDFAMNTQARRDEYTRRGWAQDSTTKLADTKKETSRPDAEIRGENQDGATTTKKSNPGKSDTLVVSSGATKGGSTVVNKDKKMDIDQTPSPDISKVSRKDRKAAMEGMDRQERKNYRDLQDTKKDMRKTSEKDAKAKAQEVTGKGIKQFFKKIKNKRDDKRTQKMLDEYDAKTPGQKEESEKRAQELEKGVGRGAQEATVEKATETTSKKGEPKMQKTVTNNKKSGPDWSKAPALNTQARKDWYTKNNLAQDKTTKVKDSREGKGFDKYPEGYFDRDSSGKIVSDSKGKGTGGASGKGNSVELNKKKKPEKDFTKSYGVKVDGGATIPNYTPPEKNKTKIDPGMLTTPHNETPPKKKFSKWYNT